MIECHLDVEPRVYITSMRVLSAISLPVNLFGMYCIAFKSPPTMKEYSRLLLVHQVFATLADGWANLLYIPVSFFPFPIIYHVGLFLPHVPMTHPYMHIFWLCTIMTTMGAVNVIYMICVLQFILFNGAIVGAGFGTHEHAKEQKPFYDELAFQVVVDMSSEARFPLTRFFLLDLIAGPPLQVFPPPL
ncbi:unnamed protein product [Heligmosomoides polygyrus]|uniref:Derlin n=1 Tax=Heligmosomoides polygyrus TaxID=6339 RepID=A0A183FWI8_HELPZ|nr:unnamed protein product [Heligmosomoides polygyrus]